MCNNSFPVPQIIPSLSAVKSSWCLNKGRPTWLHLLYYVNLLLNMFRMLIHPSSGACDYWVRYCVSCIVLTWGVLVLCSGIGCWWCGIRVQAEPLLLVLCSGIGWWWCGIRVQAEPLSSGSACKMMHAPIRKRFTWLRVVHIMFRAEGDTWLTTGGRHLKVST